MNAYFMNAPLITLAFNFSPIRLDIFSLAVRLFSCFLYHNRHWFLYIMLHKIKNNYLPHAFLQSSFIILESSFVALGSSFVPYRCTALGHLLWLLFWQAGTSIIWFFFLQIWKRLGDLIDIYLCIPVIKWRLPVNEDRETWMLHSIVESHRNLASFA